MVAVAGIALARPPPAQPAAIGHTNEGDPMKRTAATVIAALTLLGILAGGLLAAGCGGGVPSSAVATVGDAAVTKTQFDELMAEAKAHLKSQGVAFPASGSSTYNGYAAQIVDYLVQAQVVSQSAGKFSVSVTDKDVAAQVAQIEKSYGGEAKVLSILKSEGMTMALLKESIKIQKLSQLVAAKVTAKATVTDAQITAYWQAHAAQLHKSKKTATFSKAKATIRQTLLSQAQSKLWTAWLTQRSAVIGVKYAAGYDPVTLTASPTATASASPSS